MIGATGVLTGLVAGGLYLYARHDASATFSAGSTTSYESARSDAYALCEASEITAGGAAAVIAAAAAYYLLATPGRVRTVAVAPTHAGAVFVLTGAL